MSKDETTSSVEPVGDADTAVFEFPAKETQIEHYEALILTTVSETEEQAQTVFDAVKKEITDAKGEITLEENLGHRSLAYTVANTKRGFYFVVEFDMAKDALATVQEKLRIRKDITRFLIIKKRVKSEEEKVEDERVLAKIEERRKAKMEADLEEIEEEKEEKKAPAPKKVEEKTEATEESAETSEKSKKNLDKEIEKLISDDIKI